MKKNQPDCDLLSGLPLGIIHIILALIPIREAVRTCILSRQWRYIWTSLPELVFDDNCATNGDESEYKYEDIITRILFRHTGHIQKFKISYCPFGRRVPVFEEWIYFLSRHGIKEIILEFGDEFEPDLLQLVRSSIYSCGKLTSLELHFSELDPPPVNFKGFFSLKTLNLNRVKLSYNGIGSLVSVCPLLERLTVIDFREAELNISAPNLKYLELLGHCTKICLNAPVLAEMEVELLTDYHRGKIKRRKSSVCNYTYLLGSVSGLEKLAGSRDFSEYLSIGIDRCHNYLVFHHLKFIDLHHVNFEEAKEISLISHLLVGAPNLHNLKIVTDCLFRSSYAFVSEAPNLSFGFAPNFKLEKLRVVTVEHVRGRPMEKELIKILLGISPVLEMMRIAIITELGSEERRKKKQKLKDEFMGYSCASPIVKLTF